MLLQLIDVPTEFPTPPSEGVNTPPNFRTTPPASGGKEGEREGREKGRGEEKHLKKIWDAYLLLQPLKLANSNLVHNSDLGSSLTRNNFYDQNQWGSGVREHSLLISAATY